jgi:hypothetical protein
MIRMGVAKNRKVARAGVSGKGSTQNKFSRSAAVDDPMIRRASAMDQSSSRGNRTPWQQCHSVDGGGHLRAREASEALAEK